MSSSALALAVLVAFAAVAAGIWLGRSRARSGLPATPGQTVPKPAAVPSVTGTPSLAVARSWGYQLQNLDVAEAAASPFDLLVVDYSRDGSDAGALVPADLARLKRKPDGGRRIVLSYLSIGEAESYRFYWRKEWKRARPEWLLGENPDWKENFAVRFWEAGWQEIIAGTYLSRILAAGFDGVYLDKCDVVDDLRRRYRAEARVRPDLDGDMVAFVARIAAAGRLERPGFLVVMQNAEALIERPALRKVIDGVGREELLFGADRPESRNAVGEVGETVRLLDLARGEGRSIFVIEYLDDAAKAAEAREKCRRFGYVVYVAAKDRALDRLVGAPPASS